MCVCACVRACVRVCVCVCVCVCFNILKILRSISRTPLIYDFGALHLSVCVVIASQIRLLNPDPKFATEIFFKAIDKIHQ